MLEWGLVVLTLCSEIHIGKGGRQSIMNTLLSGGGGGGRSFLA